MSWDGTADITTLAKSTMPDSWGTRRDQLLGYAAMGSSTARMEVAARLGWRWRGLDYVNDNPNSKDHQLARAHEYSFEALKIVRRVEQRVDAVLDALDGADSDVIRQRIDARADQLEAQITEQSQRWEQLADEAQSERAAILDLIEQVGSGDLAADEFVDAVARRLARTDDDDGEA